MMPTRVHASLALVVLLSGGACASLRPARGGSGEQAAAMRGLNAYVDCLSTHADAMASGTGEPGDIADRAAAQCESQFETYCAAARDYFTSAASAEDRQLAVERAQARCAATRSDARDGLISRIVKERERLSERRERELQTGREQP